MPTKRFMQKHRYENSHWEDEAKLQSESKREPYTEYAESSRNVLERDFEAEVREQFIENALGDNSAIRPTHYSDWAVYDFISEQDLGFGEGNVVKYVARHGKKNGVEDLKKAKAYLEKLIEAYDEN